MSAFASSLFPQVLLNCLKLADWQGTYGVPFIRQIREIQLHHQPKLAALQIPFVDGDLWWKYVARLEKWPLEVGNPEHVDEVRIVVMRIFKPTAGSKAKSAAPPANPGCHTPFTFLKALTECKERLVWQSWPLIAGLPWETLQCFESPMALAQPWYI